MTIFKIRKFNHPNKSPSLTKKGPGRIHHNVNGKSTKPKSRSIDGIMR